MDVTGGTPRQALRNSSYERGTAQSAAMGMSTDVPPHGGLQLPRPRQRLRRESIYAAELKRRGIARELTLEGRRVTTQ